MTAETVNAPCAISGRSGLKKIGYAHTDVIFSTVHKNGSNRSGRDRSYFIGDGDISGRKFI